MQLGSGVPAPLPWGEVAHLMTWANPFDKTVWACVAVLLVFSAIFMCQPRPPTACVATALASVAQPRRPPSAWRASR